MAVNAIIFIMDDVGRMKICTAWVRALGDINKVVRLTRLEPSHVREEVSILKELGILLDGGQLDLLAEKYINSYVDVKPEDVQP